MFPWRWFPSRISLCLLWTTVYQTMKISTVHFRESTCSLLESSRASVSWNRFYLPMGELVLVLSHRIKASQQLSISETSCRIYSNFSMSLGLKNKQTRAYIYNWNVYCQSSSQHEWFSFSVFFFFLIEREVKCIIFVQKYMYNCQPRNTRCNWKHEFFVHLGNFRSEIRQREWICTVRRIWNEK